MKGSKATRALIESSMMVALATVLSILKIIEMPYGGSVTVASMLPIVVLAYRHGAGVGLGAGLVYAALQQLLGLKTLSYFTTPASVIAIILLDYIIAFTLVGLGGVFRKCAKRQSTALALGAALVSVLRYICHTVSGATVWAGLSIPTEAALVYSIGYNATYMLPEAIILVATAFYLGTAIDFSRRIPERAVAPEESGASPLRAVAPTALLLGLVADVVLIAPHLQDAESGMFVLSGLSNVSWLSVGIISAVAAVTAIVFFLLSKKEQA